MFFIDEMLFREKKLYSIGNAEYKCIQQEKCSQSNDRRGDFFYRRLNSDGIIDANQAGENKRSKYPDPSINFLKIAPEIKNNFLHN